ncbi:MAG: folate-binding protein YgfZ [Vicinamibacterales bacterium]
MSAPLSPTGYEAARTSAGIIDRHHERGRLVVSGADRRSYLHGLLTNDITALTPGSGCYACYLTAQGRMITDLWVHELGDVLLLTLPLQTKDGVLAKLDQFIFSEDVQLGDVTTTFADVAVVGPKAAAVLSSALSEVDAARLDALPPGGNLRVVFRGEPAIVLCTTDLGPRGLEVLVGVAHAAALAGALRDAGAEDVSPEAAEVLRVEAGVPRFLRDMDEETIPLEAGIESRAISLTKGCYVGQEVIIRVLHRGHGRVARKLVGLTVAGATVPASGAAIAAEQAAIGQVTSAVRSPALDGPIALGYVHRDFATPGARVRIGDAEATVTALPFAATGE